MARKPPTYGVRTPLVCHINRYWGGVVFDMLKMGRSLSGQSNLQRIPWRDPNLWRDAVCICHWNCNSVGHAQGCYLADCVNSSLPLILQKFQGFGGIWANSAKFGKFRENSGELSGIQWGFVWCLVWIQWEFLGDFGATPDFQENWGFGVVSVDLGGQKARAQIASANLENLWKCSGKCSRECSGKSGCSEARSRGCSGELGVPQQVPRTEEPISTYHLCGLPKANAKSQRFSNAMPQIATLPPVVALNRNSTLWHEIITKIIPWELFFVIFKEFCALEMSKKERLLSRNYAWDS